MVVNFTTYANLAKPTEAELASNWTRVQDLSEDNNNEIQNRANVDYTSYSMAITASVTPPTIGTGANAYLLGEYRDLNGFILGSFKVGIGTGPVTGAGVWGFRLPVLGDATFHTIGTSLSTAFADNDVIGTGYMFDTSAVATSGPAALDIIHLAGVPYARFLVSTFAGKASYGYSAGVPFTVADGDTFSGSFAYKRQ